MISQLIAPENARVCSVSGFLPCYLLWLTQGSIRHAKFHLDWFKVRACRAFRPEGQKAEKSAR